MLAGVRGRSTQTFIASVNLVNSEQLELLVTRTMPFGKYKGRLIADLPGHYLNWFASQGFPPGEIGRLLALMHEIDHNGLSSLIEPLRERHSSSSAG
uniref:Cytoplasmic protein n=1 Tax=Burkholderia sp. (strain CCGE1003) TaxID=640512 RepID=E1T6M4_BURSG